MALIDDIFPCKKRRRSSRLEVKQKDNIVPVLSRKVCGAQGYFKLLPVEIKFQIFSYLQLEDLSVLTITSKELRNVVELFRTTPWTQKYIIPMHVQHSQAVPDTDIPPYLIQFKKLGLLMKRSTCLYATKDRVRFVIQSLHKYLCTMHQCKSPVQCIALRCFGQFLHTVIAGWDDKECVKMLHAVCSATFMFKYLDTILQNKPGNNPSLELNVRLFLRRVFINQCHNRGDKAFWIQQMLKHLPMVMQARALFLLFGPMIDNEIQWYEMCESTPATAELARQCFGDLANAFSILHIHSAAWNEDDVISVMEELTSFPDEWLSENVANLLYMCGEAITLKVMHSKAINGRLAELASIITSLSMVCVRQRHDMSWVLNLVNRVSAVFDSGKQQMNFINEIINMYREVINETHEYDDDLPEYLQHWLEAQAAFSRHLAVYAVTGSSLVNAKLSVTTTCAQRPGMSSAEE